MATTQFSPSELLTPDEQLRLETIKRNRKAGFLPSILDVDFLLEITDRREVCCANQN